MSIYCIMFVLDYFTIIEFSRILILLNFNVMVIPILFRTNKLLTTKGEKNIMNKLLAKIKLNDSENFGLLIRTFFENFNSENSLNIKDNVADLVLLFKEPPKQIIESLSNYEILELNLTKIDDITDNFKVQNKKTCNKNQIGFVEETNPKIKEVKSKSKNFKSIESKGIVTKNKSKNLTSVDISKLEELAKVSVSYTDFAYLNMDSKTKIFVDIALVCVNLENFTWKDIKSALNDKSINLPTWEKNYICKKVKENADGLSVAPLTLFYSIQKYHDYTFAPVTIKSSSSTSVPVTSEHSPALDIKQKVKLQCMPEIKEFEAIIETIDKTKPVKERISYVLTPMGLNTLSEELQNQIIEIAFTALKKKNLNSDTIFDGSKIPEDKLLIVRMSFSKLLNNYIMNYDATKNIKLLDFISDLQPVIMLENEIF